MGLDMYLKGEKFFWPDWKNPENNRVEDGLKVSKLEVELGYWRKHPNLHGYIVKTFADGKDECQVIDLSIDNLEQIIKTVQNKELPHTTGFFFGASLGSDEETKEDVEIFTKAIEWAKVNEKGVSRTVLYKASW